MSEQDNSKNKRLKPQILSGWSKIKRSKISEEVAQSRYLELGDQVLNYILSDEGQSGDLITQDELRNKIKNFHFGAISSKDIDELIDIVENQKGPALLSKKLLSIENLQLDETISISVKAAGNILSSIEDLFIDRFGDGIFDPDLAPEELRDLNDNTLPYGVKSAFKYKVINALSMQGDLYSIDEKGNPRVINFSVEDNVSGNKIADYAMYNPINKSIDIVFVSNYTKGSIQGFIEDEDSVYCAFGLEQGFFGKNTAAIDMAIIQKMMGDRKIVLNRETSQKMTAKEMGTHKIRMLRNDFYSELGFIEKDDNFETSFIKIREFINTEEFSEIYEYLSSSNKYNLGVAKYVSSFKDDVYKSLKELSKAIKRSDDSIQIDSYDSLINLSHLGALIYAQDNEGLSDEILKKFMNLNFVYSEKYSDLNIAKVLVEKNTVSKDILKEFGAETKDLFTREINETLKIIRSSNQEGFRHVFMLFIATLKASGAPIDLYEESDAKDVWSFYTNDKVMDLIRSLGSQISSSIGGNSEELERKRKAAIDYLKSKKESVLNKINDKENKLNKLEEENNSFNSNLEFLQLSINSINEELKAVRESQNENRERVGNIEELIDRLKADMEEIEKNVARVKILSDESEILKIID